MQTQKAFTLIELLMIVAVIAILSTVILVSIGDAKQRSRDAAILSEVRQMATVLYQEYSDTGSFDALQQSAWIGSNGTTCAARGFTGNYSAEFIRLCESMSDRLGGVSYQMILGNSVSNRTHFSLMVKTEAKDGVGGRRFVCLGSSGQTYVGTYNTSAPGCYQNP